MQELSLSKQTFSQLRQANLIYVDKTDQIHKMFLGPKGGVYFLARPRRFGKSLLVDTLDCIFQGKKELFEGLAISKTDYQWPVHPVVRLDFANINRRTPEVFRASFIKTLYDHAAAYDIDLAGDQELGSIGATLFEQLHAKTGKRVVLLVDEYDKPILDHVEKPEVAEEMRGIMRAFYEAHKPNEEHLQFTLITGVGRFARASIFSGMNHLIDLTLHPAAATLVGYTQHEVEHYFCQHIQALEDTFGGKQRLLELIRYWYNGYRFSSKAERVYNPFSFMSFLSQGEFVNYWFGTGTSEFLIKLMAQREPWHWNQDQRNVVSVDELLIGTVANMSVDALMYQTGYLTITDVLPEEAGDFSFVLDFPNHEVRKSLQPYLLAAITNTSHHQAAVIQRKLNEALTTGDVTSFMELMQTQFARFPHQLQPLTRKERIYHLLFGALCCTLACQMQLEVPTQNGRIDAVLTTQKFVYVIEFKRDEPAQTALAQIKAKGYYQQFLHQGKQVVLLGISFDSKERTITDWVSELVA